jgi:hypothetical protein
MSTEEWREIPGFPGYDVSDAGRVRSWLTYRGKAGPRLLKTPINSSGYPALHLQTPTGGRVRPVHTLVLAAFVGRRPEGAVIRHLDGDSTNSRLANLTYGTPSENSLDQTAHGTHPFARRTHCKHGHRYTPENTAIWTSSKGRPFRACRTCHKAKRRRQRRRQGTQGAAA